jgi:hypothetical protein
VRYLTSRSGHHLASVDAAVEGLGSLDGPYRVLVRIKDTKTFPFPLFRSFQFLEISLHLSCGLQTTFLQNRILRWRRFLASVSADLAAWSILSVIASSDVYRGHLSHVTELDSQIEWRCAAFRCNGYFALLLGPVTFQSRQLARKCIPILFEADWYLIQLFLPLIFAHRIQRPASSIFPILPVGLRVPITYVNMFSLCPHRCEKARRCHFDSGC